MVTRPSVSLAFLSTPSARRATYLLTVPPTSIKISIHALREEGDDVGVDDVVHIARFLSTPSARRATRASSTATSTCSYFYPRPPRGGRLSPSCVYALHWKFLSTPSARRATKAIDDYTMQLIISIHALREEGDRRRPHQRPAGGISIHALREEGDPIVFRLYLKLEVFLSTPSARRATPEKRLRLCFHEHFYPRPPRGGRPVINYESTHRDDFYPRPPRGGRPVGRQRRPAHSDFYPRPPRGGRHEARQMGLASYLFLSTPSARRATKAAGQIAKLMQFLSTPSARRATCL